jgi:uncharacterized protein (TIGR02246 family)
VAATAVQQPAAEDRQADRDGIKAALTGLAKAFENGDAAAATALMTSGAEIIPDDAPPLRGREAIRKAYADHFAKHPKCKITAEPHELRFTSRDTAIYEGRLTIARDGDAPESQRFSMLLVREDGKWLVGLIKEWTSEEDDLEDLGWLIGSWQASRTDVEVKTTYEWFGNKAFIRGTITAREKDITLSGMQLIGKDPRTGELRIWSFGTDGGFAEGTCERDGNSWIFQSEGVDGEGEATSAKNILVRVNNDTITWQPVELTRGDEHVGDLPPVKVTRVKGTR